MTIRSIETGELVSYEDLATEHIIERNHIYHLPTYHLSERTRQQMIADAEQGEVVYFPISELIVDNTLQPRQSESKQTIESIEKRFHKTSLDPLRIDIDGRVRAGFHRIKGLKRKLLNDPTTEDRVGVIIIKPGEEDLVGKSSNGNRTPFSLLELAEIFYETFETLLEQGQSEKEALSEIQSSFYFTIHEIVQRKNLHLLSSEAKELIRIRALPLEHAFVLAEFKDKYPDQMQSIEPQILKKIRDGKNINHTKLRQQLKLLCPYLPKITETTLFGDMNSFISIDDFYKRITHEVRALNNAEVRINDLITLKSLLHKAVFRSRKIDDMLRIERESKDPDERKFVKAYKKLLEEKKQRLTELRKLLTPILNDESSRILSEEEQEKVQDILKEFHIVEEEQDPNKES